MKYYVGQRVSLLHEHGTGKVVAILDKYHVEVDLGDDFPIDVHVDEIIPVDPEEDRYFAQKETEHQAIEEVPEQLGGKLFELSLGIVPESSDTYQIFLLNPENQDALYTFYMRIKHKYSGLANGKVLSGGKDKLCVLTKEELHKTKAFYIQILFFKEGSGHPHAPLVMEFPVSREMLAEQKEYISPLKQEGWLFSLRDLGKPEEPKVEENEYFRLKNEKKKQVAVREIDLHIEELAVDPYAMSSKDILSVQLMHFDKSLSDALVDNVERLILIHGIGEGKLRQELRSRLKDTPQVKRYQPADHRKYGNGATEVILH